MDYYYFGFSETMLKILISNPIVIGSTTFFLKGVITQEHKYSMEFERFCAANGVPLYVASNKSNFSKLCTECKVKKAIMYEFGIIIPDNVCASADIVNFHPGSLITNRGPNPINWSVLIPGLGAEMCAYKIGAEIDCGECIISKKVNVSITDTPIDVKNALENHIVDMLPEVFRFFLHDGYVITSQISGGIYRKRVTRADYTIREGIDSEEIIIRKVNSQVPFCGAILEKYGKTYNIKQYRMLGGNLELIDLNGNVFTCTGDSIELKHSHHTEQA